MIESVDQLNNTIRLDNFPRRIVSLVPSQTELLFTLGLEKETVGITKFCVHPNEWYKNKSRVGGTKDVNFDKVLALAPDLIIANKEENEKDQIIELQKIAPVWVSDITSLDGAFDMIERIGSLVGRKAEAERLLGKVFSEFETLRESNFSSKKRKTAYFIWKDPALMAGNDTFINDMLNECGLLNVCLEPRYPEYNLQMEEPALVFLSSEPFPFKESHILQFESRFPNSKIILVDGEMFSWYGSRLALAPAYFLSLLDKCS